jgi:Serine dehydrogenase proteinase
VPGWGEILEELQATATEAGEQPDLHGVCKKYIGQLAAKTGRSVIVYYTDWLGGGPPALCSITLEDVQALMEVCRELPGPGLDIVLHSPGGSPEAAEALVRYLRSKYTDIRVFVPLAAMSAATMWALSADRIVMGKHSQLGPIDPQIVLPQGPTPARAILDQFQKAKEECAGNPAMLGAWMPILQQYGPALIQICENAEQLARTIVKSWLESYMFKLQLPPEDAAEKVVAFFADHNIHHSHALGIGRDDARGYGVVIDDLEDDGELQDAVLSVHHALTHALAMSSAVKIVENNIGRRFVKGVQMNQVFVQQQPSPQGLFAPAQS